MKQYPPRSAEQTETTDWFRSLQPVQPGELVGLWKGTGYPSGHPLDGVLENLSWFGKRFHPDMRADALLFGRASTRLRGLNPVFFPIHLVIRLAPLGRSSRIRNIFSAIRPLLKARSTTASLQVRMDAGESTTAMVYDRQPIADFFRRIDDERLAGMMIVEGDHRRYFFTLRKVTDPAGEGRRTATG